MDPKIQRPSHQDLIDRASAFALAQDQNGVSATKNLGEFTWEFYQQNREWLEPFGAKSIHHLCMDVFKAILYGSSKASPRQRQIPMFLGDLRIPLAFEFRDGNGEIRFVFSRRAQWAHIKAHAELEAQRTEEQIEKNKDRQILARLLEPHMANNPAITFEEVCAMLLERERIAS